jgi:superfamily II DNA or RNA helicase
MVARRDVTSRVRVCQEAGRILRSYPGKDHADIYDPLGLFDKFKLTYEAALGGMRDEPDPPVIRAAKEVLELPPLTCVGRVHPQSPMYAYLRKLGSWLEAYGYVEQIRVGSWRHNDPSEKQLIAIEKLFRLSNNRVIPILHRKALQRCLEVSRHQSKGFCSDMISILASIIQIKSIGWPDMEIT